MDLHAKQYARLNVRALQEGGVKRTLNRSFSVDPQTITLDRLLHLVARALDIRGEFSLILNRSQGGADTTLSCDWDLEGALAEEPCLDLTLQLKAKPPEFAEWDIICDADVPVAGHEASSYPPLKRKESFLDQVLQLYPGGSPPLSESEFRNLCDWPGPLRYATFRAEGAEASVRPQLWMHLLDVFPAGTGHKERQEFLNRKCEEYYGLRHSWQKLVQAGTIPKVLREVTNLVRKDVRRTDRGQSLDEHSLYNVLTTYAVHHPSVGYCQGMSDLLSPLLHVLQTEARAYTALCGLMLRMQAHFRGDGRSINTKFRHLRRAIRAHDPQLYEHLGSVGALDLLFCYRWLLLDLKREFPYEDMLRLMEMNWSSLPPLLSEKGVELYEVRFPTPRVCKSLRERVDEKDRLPFQEDHFGSAPRWDSDSSTDDDSIIHYRVRPKRRSKSEGQPPPQPRRRRHGSSDSNYGSEDEPSEDDRSEGYLSDPIPTDTDLSRNDSLDSFTSADTYFSHTSPLLPPPNRLFDGKPFLLFMCLTMILNHRDVFLASRMDGNEIGIYFDRLVRQHKLSAVLPKAKEMFEKYLITGWTEDD